MELEDLKTNWRALQESLDGKPVIDEKTIRKMIARKMGEAEGKLINDELLSAGVIALTGLAVALAKAHGYTALSLPDLLLAEGFLLAAICWQMTKIGFLIRLRRVNDPISGYLKKINRYAGWIKGEMYLCPVLVAGLLAYFFVVHGLYRNPFNLLIAVFLFALACIIAFYNIQNVYLKNMKKLRDAVRELEEIGETGGEPELPA